jgi:hypothetical protein
MCVLRSWRGRAGSGRRSLFERARRQGWIESRQQVFSRKATRQLRYLLIAKQTTAESNGRMDGWAHG